MSQEFQTNNSMTHIKSAVRRGRPTATEIIPGSIICHFLYKSRANVQFVMPSFEPYFMTMLSRRRFDLLQSLAILIILAF